ncbi:hypothetical protein [Kitasatospora sp. KL5]|uniref:hypothetical protein n=1 Tax=Kitasatospora sp. KL5 TaxID=3425125 RepID=UPI003D6E0B64
MARDDVPWATLLADPATRRRYEAKILRRGPGRCEWWLGGISDSGHGKMRAGSGPASRVVSVHVLGFGLAYGLEALQAAELVRHRCDSPSCQQPAHWLPGTRADNVLDYASRSRLAGHALADTRGAAGRAVAIRDAIKAALAADEDVEAAIERAIIAGQPGGAWQDGLW